MTAAEKETRTIPQVPAYLTPPDEAVIDGSQVVFSWEPVAGADSYRLEVAEDSRFETVTLTEETRTDTHLTVTDALETDGRPYHWRVFAVNDAGMSPSSDAIHGFYSATPEVARQHPARPDHAERLGPLTELLTGEAGHDPYFGRPEASHEPGSYGAEDELAVEMEGIETRSIGLRIGLTLAVIAGLLIFMLNFVPWAALQHRARVAGEVTYPEREQLETEAAERLSSYGTVDAAERYRIPVDSAMQRLVEEAPAGDASAWSDELPLEQ